MTSHVTNVAMPATLARAELREHPLEFVLFNNTGPITWVWLVLRIWLGFQWARLGWSKLHDPQWMNGNRIIGFWKSSLADYGKPNADVAYDWYATFLKHLLDTGSHSWFAPLIAWSEFLGGIALILGLLIDPGSCTGWPRW